MVMNKTEVKKLMVKTVVDFLIDQFDAQIEDNGDGGRFDIQINGFNGQLDRRDLEVGFWDSMTLSGHGWTAAEVLLQQEAVALENKINAEIKRVLAELEL
jgi:hypothetical protein